MDTSGANGGNGGIQPSAGTPHAAQDSGHTSAITLAPAGGTHCAPIDVAAATASVIVYRQRASTPPRLPPKSARPPVQSVGSFATARNGNAFGVSVHRFWAGTSQAMKVTREQAFKSLQRQGGHLNGFCPPAKQKTAKKLYGALLVKALLGFFGLSHLFLERKKTEMTVFISTTRCV